MLVFVSCSSKTNRTKMEYNGKLQFFDDIHGVEYTFDGKEKLSFVLPECFRKSFNEKSDEMSKEFFYCDKYKVSIEISRYKAFSIPFPRKMEKKDSLQLFQEIRINSAIHKFISYEELKQEENYTEQGKELLVDVFIGVNDTTSEQNRYYFGFIGDKNDFYEIKAVINDEYGIYIHNDFIKIFRSLEIHD